jgi:large subunit ribosomal protein L23
MKTPQDIILRPVLTEASMANARMRKYTFKVAKGVNKIEIAKAVETLFPGTKVEKVNTINCRGRFKRQGRTAGYTASSRKAIVTLSAGSKNIEFFDSML